MGIDIENNFEPKYIIPQKAKKRVAELKKYLPKAEKIILATDEDREGEAIAWHLTQALGIEKSKTPNPKTKTHSKPYERIAFHEITKEAIQKALNNPRKININLVNAQQARRVLDRLVGYKLSPFLWKNTKRSFSWPGSISSCKIDLRQRKEIEKFKPEEY